MDGQATISDVRILGRALDQVGDLLDHVHADDLATPTPCSDWDVAALVDHLVASPPKFEALTRGEQPDWDATPPRVAEGWAAQFRSHADDLIHAWHQLESLGREAPVPPGMAIAEFGVHAWDLATALGRPVEELDAEVAETALAFLRGALRPEMRGDAFAPEQPVPEGAGPYGALAAFAGRS